MSQIYENLSDLIGKTPLLKLGNYEKEHDLCCSIIAKLEYFNPGGSVKDRIGLAMIDDGIKAGVITKDTTLIEPTSGNTGIALALVAASKGLKLILTMPETMSVERRNLIKALGAKVVLTEGKLGMKGAINKALELQTEIKDSLVLQQFENPSNPEAHRKTTGPEILKDMGDQTVDILVAGVGTGGTITGVGEVLKKQNPNLKVVAIEPASSPVLSGGDPSPHKIQGIGAGFVPDILNMDIIDEIIQVKDEDAFKVARDVSKSEGLLVGISSGAALHGATLLAKRQENEGKHIVVILPDTGERYLSTDLFKEEN